MSCSGKAVVPLICLLGSVQAQASAGEDLFAMSLEQLGTVQINIATGTPTTLQQAPSVASVITAAELQAMGATDIDQAMEMIPGVHVSSGGLLYASRYFIRGIVSDNGPHALLLINGIPMTSLFTGDRGEVIATRTGLPIDIIERIEVIRGPGSALYGADAFSGVINIITKRPDNHHGTDASLAYGSFNSGYGSLMNSHQFGTVKALVALSHEQSDGDDPILESDYQTALDQAFGTNASQAPGPMPLHWEASEFRTDVVWQTWRMRASLRRNETGTAQGFNDALDPNGNNTQHRYTFDLTWQPANVADDWELEAQLSYLYYDVNTNGTAQLLPPSAFGGFPDGMLFKTSIAEQNARGQFTSLYTGWQDHQWRLGAGYQWADLYRTTDASNFILVAGDPVPTEQPFQERTDTDQEFLPENQRELSYVFVQDQWQFDDNWSLTGGLRYDYYSDVGSTLNPRAALVWQTTDTFTSKLLYGEAFRPPAFFEMYARSNPVALGDEDLDPEKLRSVELAFSWQVTSDFTWDLNLYRYTISDYIGLADTGGGTYTYQNIGKIHGQGAETEWRYRLQRSLQLMANVSYQHTREEDLDAPLGLAPQWDSSLRVVWEPTSRWQITPQIVATGSTERPAGDNRDKLDGYTSVDLSIRRQLLNSTSLTLVGRNLGNADMRRASAGPDTSGIIALPDDLPQPGRSVLLKLATHW